MEERKNMIEKMTNEQESIRSISVIAHVKSNLKLKSESNIFSFFK